jgi:hypothetical protein
MKNLKLEFTWALYFVLFSVVWIGLEKWLGFHDQYIDKQFFVSYFYAIPTIIIYCLAIKNIKAKKFLNNMTWQQGMVSGIFVSFFVAMFVPLSQFVCFEFVTPHFFENMIKLMTENKTMKAVDAANYFCLKSYIVQGIFSTLSFGVCVSGIVAYFLQTKSLK